MIFVLALTACLTIAPSQCEHVELRLETCGAVVPAEIVKWIAKHQNYRIVRWSCEPGESI